MDIKALVEQVVLLYRKLNKPQQYVVVGTGIAVIAIISFLIVFSAPKTKDDGFRPLYENLSQKDAGLIVQQLEKDQIEYKIPTDGTIEVKKELATKLRMDMANLGLPKESKVGFELFDKQEFGATDFDQQVKFVRAKEGDIARTIEQLDPVDRAKVSIAIPKKTVFVAKQSKPTASVVLKMRDGQQLSRKQVSGIKHLVAGSVAELSLENVKIVDEDGIPLGEEDAATTAGEVAKNQLRYKRNYEKIYEKKVVAMLGKFLGGDDKVVAKVTIEFDFAMKDSVEEYYDPNNVPRSEQSLEEKREGFKPKEIGGVPGAVSNIGPVQGLEDNNMREKYSKATSTINYEVSKRVSNVKGEFATIKRVTAAVVVDGKYKPKKDKDGNLIPEEFIYIPLSDDELTRIEALVKQTIGYDPSRSDDVAVSNFEFRIQPGDDDKNKTLKFIAEIEGAMGPFFPIVKYTFIALILFFFYKKVIVPFAERMMDVPTEEEELPETTIEFDDEDIEDDADKVSELRKRVENQLGFGDGLDEEQLKYDILLEKMRELTEEKTEEVAQLLISLVEDEISTSNNM
ncbi:MAG: flagellar basal-body MS-ring/collar protein FliF [Campylobacterales bacterium]|nr:flagellar basal-body MS-ring/collar protein FliF [Campylobacterales bacterium]